MCFFTVHWLAVRMRASWYFSGKSGGTWISSSTRPTMFVAGSGMVRWTRRMPSAEMPKFHFYSSCANGQTQHLMP